MPESPPPTFGINGWLEDELYQQYLHDKRTVDESWKAVFESNGGGTQPARGNGSVALQLRTGANGGSSTPVTAVVPPHQALAGEQLVPLRGPAARIAENMTASLSIPVATSQRVMPVKVIEENRRILNEHRVLLGKGKISYTHIIG